MAFQHFLLFTCMPESNVDLIFACPQTVTEREALLLKKEKEILLSEEKLAIKEAVRCFFS